MQRWRYVALLATVLAYGGLNSHPAIAAASLAVTGWSCPASVNPAGTDPATFAATCDREVPGLTFALTAGDLTRRRVTGPGQPATWPIVQGPFTLALETAPGQPGVVFCLPPSGAALRFDAPNGQFAGELPGDGAWTCRWYILSAASASPAALPASPTGATPTASTTPTATATVARTATPTATIAPTATLPPPTATMIPTATPFPTPVPTATPTATTAPTATPTASASATATERPDPRATATAAASAIAGTEPDYALPLHALVYNRGDHLKVYPDPQNDKDLGLDVGDFVADVTFINPDPGPDGAWDYGFLLGPTDPGGDYRVYARSDGRWFVDLGDKTLRQGELRRFGTDKGESHTLRLIVSTGRGILFVDGHFVASFDLSARKPTGKLWLATSDLDGPNIAFRDLSVWTLQ